MTIPLRADGTVADYHIQAISIYLSSYDRMISYGLTKFSSQMVRERCLSMRRALLLLIGYGVYITCAVGMRKIWMVYANNIST